MSKALRVPERLFRSVLWIVALVFAYFLTDLGGLVIRDLPRIDPDVRIEQFRDEATYDPLSARRDELARALKDLENEAAKAEGAQVVASNDYRAAADQFKAWLATRAVTQQSEQDPELVRRTRRLDVLRDAERDAQRALEAIEARRTQALQETERVAERLDALDAQARSAMDRELGRQQLRVFGIRLAATLPPLALAAWLVWKRRTSRYWPFVYGFALFAANAFFFELLPYLPSYGGYVRSAVGIALTLLAGTYGVRALQAYLARKQAEAAQPQTSRREAIVYERALDSMKKGTCPACERSVKFAREEDVDNCMHCGLNLYRRCACGQRHSSFFHFCPKCGQPKDGAGEPQADATRPAGPPGPAGGAAPA